MYSLVGRNSFRFNVSAKNNIVVSNLNDVSKDDFVHDKVLVLGEGSNVAFVDDFAGSIVSTNNQSLTITECSDSYSVEAGASHNWHHLVVKLLRKGIYGLENLALIPGSVGAAPVQNIGAYGAEFANFCESIEVIDLYNRTTLVLAAKDCGFGYRDSIFKQKFDNKYLITKVTLRFTKDWFPNLSYKGLDELPLNVAPHQVFNQVVSIRRSKLPDPKLIGNAGSFFKNPIVKNNIVDALLGQFEKVPFFPVDDGFSKLSAAWLIDQCGLKGKSRSGIGCYYKQPLVLVNNGNGNGGALLDFARYVRDEVQSEFGITLQNEVRLIGKNGLISL